MHSPKCFQPKSLHAVCIHNTLVDTHRVSIPNIFSQFRTHFFVEVEALCLIAYPPSPLEILIQFNASSRTHKLKQNTIFIIPYAGVVWFGGIRLRRQCCNNTTDDVSTAPRPLTHDRTHVRNNVVSSRVQVQVFGSSRPAGRRYFFVLVSCAKDFYFPRENKTES